MVSGKGKEKLIDNAGKGKRKCGGNTATRKRKSRNGVLQFFDDEAYHVDEDQDNHSDDDSMFDDLDDFVDEDFTSELNALNNSGKLPQPPITPKEEDMSEEELERMLSERYKPGSGFVTYSEDIYEHKNTISRDIYVSSSSNIWRVKCMIGRERYSAVCIMQKYADMEKMGKKLLVISVFAPDHVKGFIFIEADKQNDIYEACKGLSTIYSSKMAVVPDHEKPRLFSVRSTSCAVNEGTWARVRNGRYKGDLAQVVSVNQKQKRNKVTIKLVPRVDLKALAAKFGGGVSKQRNAIPPQRLISSSELEEFRPLIQHRLDQDTNQIFEFLDGMTLKDGYLYKKVPVDSLTYGGVTPTDDELVRFQPAKEVDTAHAQWLSQLMEKYNKKNVKIVKNDKGAKSCGSSSTSIGIDVAVDDLVFFGRKDFGIVIGMEKDNTLKVMKAGPEGPVMVNVKENDVKSASFDEKLFSVLDQRSKPVSVNDTVRILEGPLKDREGVVKKIYKGVLFLFDRSEEENGGYLCAKAHNCEKLSLPCDAATEKGDQGFSDFADVSSPKTPLPDDQSSQDRDNKANFARQDDEMFSVGQSLRIRVGPLKGYLCRVLAVRRSDVTVKLDSLHKIFTVKSDHLSEVRGRDSIITQGENMESVKPFNFLSSENVASGWIHGITLPSEEDSVNAGQSTERTSWSLFPPSNASLSKESRQGDCGNPVDEDSSWIKKTSAADQDASWASCASKSWRHAAENTSGAAGASMASWGKTDGSTSGLSKPGNFSSWENDDKLPEDGVAPVKDADEGSGGWTKPPTECSNTGSWNKPKSDNYDADKQISSNSWGRTGDVVTESPWNKKSLKIGTSSWNSSHGSTNGEGDAERWNNNTSSNSGRDVEDGGWGAPAVANPLIGSRGGPPNHTH